MIYIITKKDLNYWYQYHKQVANGYHMEKEDWKELIRLNHLVMDECHDVHNKNMIDDTPLK